METQKATRVTTPRTRRKFLKSMLAAGAAPWIVPACAVAADGKTPPSGTIALGVIGAGAQGQVDMQAFLRHEDVRIRAICDVNKRNLASAGRRVAGTSKTSDVKLFSDFRELAAEASIDAVLMALPVHWHSIAALETILHGKHIYHEKPMGMSLEESQRVRAAVKKTAVVFQFGTQQRSDLYFRWACELALNGRLGRLKEIQVSVPGGKRGPLFPQQAVPDYVDWDRWIGPAPATPFNENKLIRDWHENISNFSLGMISCWGIHHLDIAQWGNAADATGPRSVEGRGEFPQEGSCDTILRWKVRFEYEGAAPVIFASEGQGIEQGVRFVGDSAWVHVDRGSIRARDDKLLRDPQNKYDTMPVKLPISRDHVRNFLDAVKSGGRAICDVATAVRSDTLCQIALIAVKQGHKLQWDPTREQFVADDAANRMLLARPIRGPWKLPAIT